MAPKNQKSKKSNKTKPYQPPERMTTRTSQNQGVPLNLQPQVELLPLNLQPQVELPTPAQALVVSSNVTRAEFTQMQATMQASMDSMQSMMQGVMSSLAVVTNAIQNRQPSAAMGSDPANNAPTSTGQAFNQRPVDLVQQLPTPSTSADPSTAARPIPVSNSSLVDGLLPVQPQVSNVIPPLMSVPTAASSVAAPILQQHVDNILNAPAPAQGKSSIPISVVHDIDQNVPQSVMKDIWEEKFIELESLIDKPELELALSSSVMPGKPGDPVTWAPAKKNKIFTLSQWSSAFQIFVAVYTRRYPEQAPNLMTYAAKVRSLAQQKGDFISYDRGFRQGRERYLTPWQKPDLELWVECFQTGLRADVNKLSTSNKSNNQAFRTGSSSSQSQSNKVQHPAGTCYMYHNRGGKCTRNNCKFPHSCYFPGCTDAHSIYSCPKYKAAGGASSGKPHVSKSSSASTSSSGVRNAANSGKSS